MAGRLPVVEKTGDDREAVGRTMLFKSTHKCLAEMADMLYGDEQADKTFKSQKYRKGDDPDNNV